MVFIKFRGEGPKFENPIFYESSHVFVFLRKSIRDTWVSYIFHCGRMPGVSNLKEEGLTLTHGSGDFSPSKLRGTKLNGFHQNSPEAEKRHRRNQAFTGLTKLAFRASSSNLPCRSKTYH